MRPPDGFRGIFRDDDEARAVYSEAAGIARIVPRAVAVPADAADVQTLVRGARETGTPLPFSLEGFDDLDASVRKSIQRVRTSPFLQHRDAVRGFVLDVNIGSLREIR